MRIVAISALVVLCAGCAQRAECQFCGSQWNRSIAPAASDKDYQRDYSRRTPEVAEDGVKYRAGTRQTHSRRVRQAADRPARRTTGGRFTTDLSAYPPLPTHDSPAGQQERRESERLDKALQRTLNSVCKGC